MRRIIISILKAPIYAYKYLISPMLGQNCRFYPTCSTYALEALEIHGPIKGSWLAIKRISKCHPYSKCNCIDPVPPKDTHRSGLQEETRLISRD